MKNVGFEDDISFEGAGTFSAALRYGKLIVYILLCITAALVAVGNLGMSFAGVPSMYVVIPAIVVLLAENAVKMWGFKHKRYKMVCYVLDILILLVITVFTNGSLISTFYIIILSEFYLTQASLTVSTAMGMTSIALFLGTLGVSGVIKTGNVSVNMLIAGAFNDLILLALHFLVFNFSVQVYRKNKEISLVLAELRESNEKLRNANEELKEIAVLEERQRIAKDIHDTAGHSITTVIMQTEAARLVLDTDPEDARRKISAANLQAKHALEELRGSVHLLSGSIELTTLHDALFSIVHDTMDGTGVTVRAEIDEIDLGGEKKRFLCNTLKEGISNGIRHGGATAFWFECKLEGENVHFLLTDNGSGADMKKFKEGFGLKGMRQRAEEHGGTLRFESEAGEGFEIHMRLPMDKEETV